MAGILDGVHDLVVPDVQARDRPIDWPFSAFPSSMNEPRLIVGMHLARSVRGRPCAPPDAA